MGGDGRSVETGWRLGEFENHGFAEEMVGP
jgi:hypothetical protein